MSKANTMEMKEGAELPKEFKETLAEMSGKFQAWREEAKMELKELEELRVFLQIHVLQNE